MTPWKLTLGLAVGAGAAALFAPRLFPFLPGGSSTPAVPVLPVAPPIASDALAVATSEAGSVRVTARLDHGAVPRGVPTDRYLVVEVAGPDEVAGVQRSPVDLAVVIDASGSMSDARKIDFARRGASFLLSELAPT